jgi:hypothetical protein
VIYARLMVVVEDLFKIGRLPPYVVCFTSVQDVCAMYVNLDLMSRLDILLHLSMLRFC